MHPIAYSRATPPHARVGQFVADEPRLGWLFKFLRHLPKTEAYIVGGSARDAVQGVLPRGIHVMIRNLPLKEINIALRTFGLTDHKNDTTLFFRPNQFKHDSALEISIPDDHGPAPFAPITHDLSHRDFTVNAMAYGLNSGLLIDPFGGVRDLSRHELRAVGRPSARFTQHPLRTLRALRLASEHGYAVESATWQALKTHLPSLNRLTTNDSGLAVFATPRAHIGHEFLRILSGHPRYGLKLWHDSGASQLFTPEIDALNQTHHHTGETSLEQATQALGNLMYKEPTLVFTTLLAHLENRAVESAQNLITRLHLHAAHPEFNHEQALWILEHRRILEEAEPAHMPASVFERLFGQRRGQRFVTFLQAHHQVSGQYNHLQERLHQAIKRQQELVTGIKKPALLHGHDLETLGILPGPQYRKLLSKLRDAQLDGHVNNREEALNYLRNILSAQVV